MARHAAVAATRMLPRGFSLVAALALACGGSSPGSNASSPAATGPAAPASAAPKGKATKSSALGAASAPATHTEFKNAGYQCVDCHPCGGITTGHTITWMDPTSPAFHGLAANRGLAQCQQCHGVNLDGVAGTTTIACASCHDQNLPAGVTTWSKNCVMCHGGTDNQSGAPPRATLGNEADVVRAGAHTAHVAGTATAQALDCGVCHVKPADALDVGHTGAATAPVAFAGLAVQAGATPTAWNRATPTCAGTYCHGNFKNGNAQNAPDWTQVGTGQAKCGTCHGVPPGGTHPSVPADVTRCNVCHPASVDATGKVLPGPGGKHLDGSIDVTASHPSTWMAPVSPNFHATSANRGLGACQACHGQDLSGGFSGVSCASCHGDTWATTCTMCHGGSHEPSGAPPKATWGNSADLVRVGAHTAHVKPSAASPGYDCVLCHVKPANAFSAGHIDGNDLAEVQLAGLATAGGATPAAWNRAVPTCASTYCHGNFTNGNRQNAPDWAQVGTGQASCGTCHGLPPAGTHPAVSSDVTGCSICHPASVDAAGNVKPTSIGGKHLDGNVDVQASHDPSWTDTASPSFHAVSANKALSACQTCHGLDLSGGFAGVSCAQCHGASWKTSCTMCHGGGDNATGAPPRATWGNAADPVRVGAHTSHVAGSARAQAYDCTVCHVVPTDALTGGHIDGPIASVNFAGLATTGSVAPSFDRASATCSGVYCHGATLGGGSLTKPVWTTVDGSQAKCGTCHGLPPPAPHPSVAGGLTACVTCHQGSVDGAGAVKPAPAGLHLDGKKDNNAYHLASWADQTSPAFHAFSANLGLATCQSCHGADLSGGSAGVSCAQCHGGGWQANCIMCHGAIDNNTGAPPRARWGNTDPIAIGAHTKHVASTLAAPIGCDACHVKPADAFAANHLGNGPAEVAAAVGWNRTTATCASASCHGVALANGGGSLTQPVWTRVDGTQAACGTCHGVPPPSPHPGRSDCESCHTGYTQTTVNAAAHVNGTVDVVALTCSSCHGSGVNAAPPLGTHGETLTTARAVGAHQAHLGATHAQPVACSECHVVPTDMLHANGNATVQFGALTATGGLSPQWNGATCASTWCHGASLSGGSLTAPTWTKVDGTQDACGTCHGLPPTANGHVARTDCGSCHTGYTATSTNPALHVNGKVDVVTLTCSTCHGSGTNAAPPVGTHGETLTTAMAVGAHQAHVAATNAPPVGCSECHVVPTTMAHADGQVNVTFGALSKTGGASPSFDFASGTCASTYCHGATLNAGGTLTAPVWNKVDGTQDACGTCHGSPPPIPHPQDTSCGTCHAGYTQTTVNAATHVNGVVDVIGGSVTCTSCHGTSGVNAAPPIGTRGETATTARAVGAHQAHLAAKNAKPVACGECHVVPTSNEHAEGTPTVTFGALTTTGGVEPRWNGTTCSSTYCHGATLSGGTLTAPSWTTVDGTQDACGTCHGIPPTANGHVARTDCGTCHNGYTSTTVNAAIHVDGKVDVGTMTCTTCHGASGRASIGGADSNQAAAPPADTHGNTAVTARGVGAHVAHVNQATFRSAPIACSECHFNSVPTSMTHANGTVAFAFGTLASNASWGGVTPAPAWTGTTCANTYCHGAFKNGAAATVTWAQSGGVTCGSCHAIPPAGGHVQNTNCGNCHTGYTSTTVNKATHLNGALDVVALTCTSCHGKAGQSATASSPLNAAPPVDTLGASSGLRVGAHQPHLVSGPYTNGLPCQTCHASVATYTATHSNGTANVGFTGATPATMQVGSFTPRNGSTAASCSSTWCHAVTDRKGDGSNGNLPNPAWTATVSSCGNCHGTPPSTGSHQISAHQRQSCSACHSGYSTSAVNKSLHVNGVRDVGGSGTQIRSWNASTMSCSPQCHGSETWGGGSSGWGGGGWGH